MTRKLFALLLACLLILMNFTACGTKTPEPGTTAAEDISAAETEANAQTSAEETAASSEAVSESAEESTAQSAQKPTADKPASKPAATAKSNNSGSASKGKLEVSAGSVKSITGAKVLAIDGADSNPQFIAADAGQCRNIIRHLPLPNQRPDIIKYGCQHGIIDNRSHLPLLAHRLFSAREYSRA